MGTRRRVMRVSKGKLAKAIEIDLKRNELIGMIRREQDCSWTEAKKIQKFRQVARNISREFNQLNLV
jgi:hypothetical protein|tara:strand:- start:760 stop:960 length:201 start_codon:yes stop_codon:yes gene_type:complete